MVPVFWALIVDWYAPARTEAPRKSSFEACQYCNALLHCPEVLANLDTMVKIGRNMGDSPAIDPDTIDDTIEKIKICDKIGKAYLEEAKSFYNDGGHSEKWGMQSRKGSLKIDGGTRSVYDLVSHSISIEEFMATCRVSLPKLRQLYTEKKGLDKKKGAEAFEKAIDPLTSRGKDVQVLQKKRDQTND